MYLIAVYRAAGQFTQCACNRTDTAMHTGQCLFLAKYRLCRQIAKPLQRTAALGHHRIADPLPQHLITATDAKQDTALCVCLRNHRLHTAAAQPAQIVHRIFRSG